MDTVVSKLTVYFDEPFWACLYERESTGRYEACKITFGAEPRDFEVYDFFLINHSTLKFSPSVETATKDAKRINPKRLQRLIEKQTSEKGIGTKAQQALKLQYEENKQERKLLSREKTEAEKERQFELRQEKRKEKHRGH